MVEKPSSRKVVVDLGGGLRPYKNATINVDSKRCKHIPGVKFIQHDLNKLPLPFKDNSVDMFILDNVLEHLDVGPEEIFKDIRRCLKTYGRLMVIVPNSLFLSYRLEYLLGIIPKDFILEHKKHFTHHMIEYSLKNAGLKINTQKNWKSFLPFRNLLNTRIKFIAYKVPG